MEHSHAHFYVLPMASFYLQWQNWVAAETIWSTSLKYLLFDAYRKYFLAPELETAVLTPFSKDLDYKTFLYHYKVLTLSSPSTFLFQRNARHMEKQYFNSTFSWYKKWTESNLFILNKCSVVRKTNFKNTGTGTGRHLGSLSNCSEENMNNRNLCCKFHTHLPMVCNEINKSFYFIYHLNFSYRTFYIYVLKNTCKTLIGF